MMPTPIHAGIHSVTPQFSSIPLISSQNLSSRPRKTSIPRRRPFDLDRIVRTSYRRNQREFFACATAEAAVAESPTDESTPSASQVPSLPPVPEGSKVVVKEAAKPRLVLKFIWMEKNIGLGLDQSIPGHGTIPLSPYYFWPRKDAWEELKTTLESKPWISQKTMIILLNQATDIINLWQQSGGTLS